jgi:hypothetical protein
MIIPTVRRLSVLSFCALVLATVGCASSENLKEGLSPEFEWWNEPGEIQDALVSVGSSKILGNMTAARNSAEADARAKIAQTVRAKIQSLVTNWFKEAGDNLDDDTLSSYINNEGLVRQMTDVDIVGARPVKYKTVDGYMFVLMVVEDPAQWTQFLGKSLKDQVLKDATLFKTEVLKNEFEAKLDALIQRDADNAKELVETITGGSS